MPHYSLLIGGAPFSHTMAVHVVAQLPEIASRVPKDSGENPPLFQAEVEPGNEILHMSYRTKEQTFQDAARKILELEKALNP